MKYILLFFVLFIICGCRKDYKAEKCITRNWVLENFYVNNVDATDSINNLMPLWFYAFGLNPNKIQANHTGWGGNWSMPEKDASQLTTRITYSDSLYAGPFLAPDTIITWELNPDKLCDDDELWISTYFNNIKYECHFVSI